MKGLSRSSCAQRGFTLVEVVVVAAIVAILLAIAVPTYSDIMRSARRADAMAALLEIQLAQEKWRANNVTYTTVLANLGMSSGKSPDGYYDIVFNAAATATTFTASASAPDSSPQDNDDCGMFTVNQNGLDTSGTYKDENSNYADARCWKR